MKWKVEMKGKKVEDVWNVDKERDRQKITLMRKKVKSFSLPLQNSFDVPKRVNKVQLLTFLDVGYYIKNLNNWKNGWDQT